MDVKVIPITERQNSITQDIGEANPKEIVEQLHKCDEEIFTGWGEHQNVLSSSIITIIYNISAIAAKFVKTDANNTGIILSGCGTSGRIAFFISRKFNEFAQHQNLRPCYNYIISGGDQALMMSVESCEDNWNAGKRELEKAAKGLDKVLFIGITCGLSAPFVGGQVEYCLENPQRFTPYLLGFNPADQAKTAPISGTDKVMLDIALEMDVSHMLLNPIVGPEPITGSSRMKCGTATKLILEAIFLIAHQSAANDRTTTVDKIAKAYQMTLIDTHNRDGEIASLINMAGSSLAKGGCVSYIAWGSLGIMGMIDAAECVPTFGANHDDIRCYLENGYEFLRNFQGDLSAKSDALGISFNYFLEKRCPNLSENDTVIFIINNLTLKQKQELSDIAELVRNRKVKLALIAINTKEDDIRKIKDKLDHPVTVHIVLQSLGRERISYKYRNFIDQCVAEVSLKWAINAVSTGAHILKGKVYKNSMIDLKLTNGKLFERGVRIISGFGNVSSDVATLCLLRSIYRQDEPRSSIKKADISEHLQKAGYQEKVIPLAMLLTKGFQVKSGLEMLEKCPIVRQCIESISTY